MAIVELADKVQADIRPAIGNDEATSWLLRARFEPFLEDRPKTGSEYMFQSQFALCVICTKWVVGVDFDLPSVDASGEVLADAYRKWMGLRRGLFNTWRNAPDTVDAEYNSAELLPPEMLTEADKADPLSSTPVKSNGAK